MTLNPTLDDLLDEATWLEWRSLAIPALRQTDMVTTEQTRAEFVHGARLLRLDKRKRAGDGGSGPSPIQLVIADVLNAGNPINAVLEPRRTTKTTAIQCVALGRCEHREDYRVGWTMATTGAKAGEIYRAEIVAQIERYYFGQEIPFDINKGKGTEHIAWPNGSRFNVYAPGGDGFRGGGFDFTVIDEGGEAEPDLSAELLAGVLPTLDTKPEAQFVVAGTAAKYRDGNILWDTLEDPEAAVIRHAIPDSTDPEEMEAWEPDEDHPRARMRELIQAAHPGIDWTTPLAAVKRNFHKLPREGFLAEYGGIFGAAGKSAAIIAAPLWERAALDVELPPPPARFALAIAVHPDGHWASAGVTFEYSGSDDLVSTALKLEGIESDERKRVAVALLHHQQGTHGFAQRVLMLSRKYRVPIAYDSASQAAGVEIETLSRATPRPQFKPGTTVDVRRAATKFLKSLEAWDPKAKSSDLDAYPALVHFRKQAPMQRAAEIAIKRAIGAAGGFGFGRPRNEPTADITPLEACSLALHFLDDAPKPVDPNNAFEF